MGCHTGCYVHIPEKQEYYKDIILENQKYWSQFMLDFYKDKENEAELQQEFKDFINRCEDFLSDIENTSIEGLISDFDSTESLKEEIQFSKEASEWSYNDFINWCISENQRELNQANSGKIAILGSFQDPNNELPGGYLYEMVNDKLYIHGLIPHGDDLGRIYDYDQPNCYTAEDTIKCFKEHKVEYDEELIKQLFDKYDMFVQFG